MTIRARGFTLIEMMVAITLGILLSFGLVTLFGATSKTNRVQDAMAQLQENGRYAIARLNADIRMIAYEKLDASGFVTSIPTQAANPSGVGTQTLAPTVYVDTLVLPDFVPASGLVAPAGWPAGTPWPLSQRYMIQGYECSSATCSPATVPATIPGAGAGNNQRVRTADVLTVRYVNSAGWLATQGELSAVCAGNDLTSITVTPALAAPPVPASPAFNFVPGDLALLVAGSSASIFRVNVAGNMITPNAPLGGRVPCGGNSADAMLYNFSSDFITATYYTKLKTDPNDPTRLIPVLVRRQSTINNVQPFANDPEIVQGIEQLDFLYGVERKDGTTSFLTAADTQMQTQSTFANCPPAPYLYIKQLPPNTVEPQCLWRAVKNIEVHVLANSVKNNYNLTPVDMAYQYTYAYDGTDAAQTPAVPPCVPVSTCASSTLPSGLAVGKMLRREFISLVSVRNYNP